MEMYDINWLLSATAQCTATIVAILGGFIATRLMSNSTKRKEIQMRIEDIDAEIKLKEPKIFYLKILLYGESLSKGKVSISEEKKDEYAGLKINQEILTQERDRLSYRQKSLEQPKDVLIGLVVLAFYAIIGILFPLIFIIVAPVDELISTIIGWADITFFAVGLFILILYFVWFFKFNK